MADSNRPDAGLYHYPYINYLNNEKIIFGLSNINSRFGHISILQYLSAISNNFFFLTNGMLLPNALIPMAIYLYFFFEILNTKKKNNNDYLIFNIICLIFFTYKMNRYGEYGNDYYAHYYAFFLVSLILKFKKFLKSETLFFYCSYIFALKITFINFFILPLLFLKKKIKILKLLFPFLIVLMWLIKNIIVSGCIIYPVEFSCFKKIDWTNNIKNSEQNSKNVNQLVESWSKGWPDQKKKLSYSDYNKNFNWLKVWSNNHGLKIFKILIIFLFLIFFIFYFLEKKKISKTDISLKKTYIKILFICFLGIILWFVKYPVYRLGISNFIIFFSILYIFINNNLILIEKNHKIIKSICVFCLLIFISKNLIKIKQKYNYHYNNYPFPKFYSFDKNNYQKRPTPIYKNNRIIYYKQNGLCMYSISPCTNENVSDKLYLTTILSYKFLKFKDE